MKYKAKMEFQQYNKECAKQCESNYISFYENFISLFIIYIIAIIIIIFFIKLPVENINKSNKEELIANEEEKVIANHEELLTIEEEEEEDLIATEEEDLIATKEEDLIATKEEDLIATEEEDLIATKEEDLIATEEEDLIATEEEDLIATEEEDLIATEEELIATEKELLLVYEEELLLANYNKKQRKIALQEAYKEKLDVLLKKRKEINTKLDNFNRCGYNLFFNTDSSGLLESVVNKILLLRMIHGNISKSISNEMPSNEEILRTAKKAGVFESPYDILELLKIKTNAFDNGHPFYDEYKEVLSKI